MAYTDFYCQNGGSNVNAGSTNNNTPTYTKAHGNWTNSTGIFTVQDGTNPSASVSVGQWGAIMVDGGTIAAYIGRITAVQNANNGTITLNTAGIGTKPANQTATATITVGGAWQGPNGASGFPFTLGNWGNNKDATGHMARALLKNDQTYSITSTISVQTGTGYTIEGYSSSSGDDGKATIDGGTSTGSVITTFGTSNSVIKNIIFKTSISSGATTLVTTGQSVAMIRCVFTGARIHGLNAGSNCTFVECESYGNNTSGTSGGSGMIVAQGATLFRCFIHDNTGTNSHGLRVSAGPCNIRHCVISDNSLYGLTSESTTANNAITIANTDFYNNGSDSINIASGNVNHHWIENCNFIKNTGAGINNVSVINDGYVYNCGYGAGTQANGSADTLNNLSTSGAVTYASNATPWNAPTTGDFSIVLAAAESAGRGHFEENDGTHTGTVGYPDIGAAQALITPGAGGGKSSHVFCG